MASQQQLHAGNAGPPLPLLHARDWVLQAFDQATRLTSASVDHLQRWRQRTDRGAERRSQQLAAALAGDGHQRAQLRRLCALAPAAVAWVERHRDSADRLHWLAFRGHLDRRCQSIMAEQPHAEACDD